MSKLLTPGHCRIAIQICAMTAVAALMSGCSADSSRFGDAFGNPFATGSVQKPKKVVHTSGSAGTGRTPPVTASALPPRTAQLASAAPARSAPLAVSHETTGSIGPAHAVPGASFGGWTGQGGASVQVGQGDTAAKLAERYGVPLNVLLQVNGLRSAAEVQPGGTIVVPIYNAVATGPGTARVAQAAPVRSEPVEPAEPARVAPTHVARPEVARAAEPAEPARKAATLPFKVAEKPQTLAERNAEAQRIVATQRAADRVAAEKTSAAEKASASQKAAEMDRVAALRKAAAAEKVAEAERAKLAKAEAVHRVAGRDAASRAETQKAALAERQAAAQKLVADREAAKAKAEAVKSAAAAAKAARLAAATPAKAAPAPAPAKPEQLVAVEKKAVDTTTTASVPAAPAAAPAAGAEATGPEFRWPAHGRIIQGFKGGTGGNDGINIAVPEGTAVKAAEGGVVAYAGSELKGYGNLVLIRHPNGYVTAYANNGEIDVKRGETVKRGQMIAKSGQSGNVSSPQLHFEVRKGSTPIDPTGFLAGT